MNVTWIDGLSGGCRECNTPLNGFASFAKSCNFFVQVGKLAITLYKWQFFCLKLNARVDNSRLTSSFLLSDWLSSSTASK